MEINDFDEIKIDLLQKICQATKDIESIIDMNEYCFADVKKGTNNLDSASANCGVAINRILVKKYAYARLYQDWFGVEDNYAVDEIVKLSKEEIQTKEDSLKNILIKYMKS